MRFIVDIELNQTSMETGEDLSQALASVAQKLPYHLADLSQDSGYIHDADGIVIGRWGLEE